MNGVDDMERVYSFVDEVTSAICTILDEFLRLFFDVFTEIGSPLPPTVPAEKKGPFPPQR